VQIVPPRVGRYRIDRPLPQGGMGTLYLAYDTALDRVVVVKMIRADIDSASLRERFEREARALSGFRHPNIVTIHDYGQVDGQPYLVMEYIDGESVAELIARKAELPLARKVEIMDQLCAAVAYVHRAKMVHRDLKPANIMIDGQTGAVKLLDFGIARRIETAVAQFTSGVGTPCYMAPEQVTNGAIDPRTDVFALGAIAYELLSYRRAFDGDTLITVADKIVRHAPLPIANICPDLDHNIIATVNKALEKQPGHRHVDAQQMRAELQAATKSDLKRDTTSSHNVRKPSLAVIAIAAGMAVAIYGLAAHFRQAGQPKPPLFALKYTLSTGAGGVSDWRFRPDNRKLVFGHNTYEGERPIDNSVRIVDLSSGQVEQTLAGGVTALGFTTDGRILMSVGRLNAQAGEQLNFWSADGWKLMKTLSLGLTPQSVSCFQRNNPFDPKDKSGRDVVTTLTRVFTFSGNALRIASMRDDQTLSVWDVSTGNLLFSRDFDGGCKGAGVLAFSDRGKWLAWTGIEWADWSPDGTPFGSSRSVIRLMDEHGTLHVLRPQDNRTQWADGLAFSPDERLMASIETPTQGRSKIVRLWDVAAERDVRSLSVDGLAIVAAHDGWRPLFTPDGRFLFVGGAFIDVQSASVVSRLAVPVDRQHHVITDPLHNACGRPVFSADGQWLACSEWEERGSSIGIDGLVPEGALAVFHRIN
jgi:serine/threonine protein kinase